MTDLIPAVCWACVAGQPDLCTNPQPIEDAPDYYQPCGALYLHTDDPQQRSAGRPVASPDELTDDVSAGRKRAAMMAPIMVGMRCEWAGLKHAGGGVIPILGCQGNTIADVKKNIDLPPGIDEVGHRHHGPDKAVLNNAVEVNLHRVCTRCHNRWHALNDPHYVTPRPHVSRPWVPREEYFAHDAFTTYTTDEYELAEAWWALSVDSRGEYPLLPSAETRRFAPLDNPQEEPLESNHNVFL